MVEEYDEVKPPKEERPAECWTRKCQICKEVPTVGDSALCGPCFFGEAETMGGNW